MEGYIGIPDERHRLLLRAALLSGEDAVRAWESWIAQADIDTLDGGSLRLIPLLYSHLKAMGIEHPEMGRFKGMYRHYWYRNQLLMAGAAAILRAFADAGIPTLLLKGAALVHGAYADFGLRPMSDFDVLIPEADALRAMQMLVRAGWVCTYEWTDLSERMVVEFKEHPFRSPSGLELDLHWHVMEPGFSDAPSEWLDARFWEGARPVECQGVPTAVPCATDTLLHVCVHGSEGNLAVPPVRWVADAMTLLRQAGRSDAEPPIDWDRLLESARRQRLSLPLRDTLGFLVEELGAPVPASVLRDLAAMPKTRRERWKYMEWSAPPQVRSTMEPPRGVLQALRSHREEYEEWARSAAERNVSPGLARYFQETWELESVSRVPGMLVRRGLSKIPRAAAAAMRRQALWTAWKAQGR